MPALKVLTVPNQLLRQKAQKIEIIDDEIKQLAQDMIDTVYKSGNSTGIAANQVGVLKRIFISAMTEEGDIAKEPTVMINPEIIWKSDEIKKEFEGCMSIPECYGKVERPVSVEVKYLDLDSKVQTLKAHEWFARNILHELDHLDGILFVDHLSRLRREQMNKKFKEMGINPRNV